MGGYLFLTFDKKFDVKRYYGCGKK